LRRLLSIRSRLKVIRIDTIRVIRARLYSARARSTLLGDLTKLYTLTTLYLNFKAIKSR